MRAYTELRMSLIAYGLNSSFKDLLFYLKLNPLAPNS